MNLIIYPLVLDLLTFLTKYPNLSVPKDQSSHTMTVKTPNHNLLLNHNLKYKEFANFNNKNIIF